MTSDGVKSSICNSNNISTICSKIENITHKMKKGKKMCDTLKIELTFLHFKFI